MTDALGIGEIRNLVMHVVEMTHAHAAMVGMTSTTQPPPAQPFSSPTRLN
jgi:hypothetical protein